MMELPVVADDHDLFLSPGLMDDSGVADMRLSGEPGRSWSTPSRSQWGRQMDPDVPPLQHWESMEMLLAGSPFLPPARVHTTGGDLGGERPVSAASVRRWGSSERLANGGSSPFLLPAPAAQTETPPSLSPGPYGNDRGRGTSPFYFFPVDASRVSAPSRATGATGVPLTSASTWIMERRHTALATRRALQQGDARHPLRRAQGLVEQASLDSPEGSRLYLLYRHLKMEMAHPLTPESSGPVSPASTSLLPIDLAPRIEMLNVAAFARTHEQHTRGQAAEAVARLAATMALADAISGLSWAAALSAEPMSQMLASLYMSTPLLESYEAGLFVSQSGKFVHVLAATCRSVDALQFYAKETAGVRALMAITASNLADKAMPWRRGEAQRHMDMVAAYALFLSLLWSRDHALRLVAKRLRSAGATGPEPHDVEQFNVAFLAAFDMAIAGTATTPEHLDQLLPPVFREVMLPELQGMVQLGTALRALGVAMTDTHAFRDALDAHLYLQLMGFDEGAVASSLTTASLSDEGSDAGAATSDAYARSVKSYHVLREDCGATDPCLELALLLRGGERGVSPARLALLREAPVFHILQAVKRHTNMHVCYVNDLMAGPREFAASDHTALTVRYRALPAYPALVASLAPEHGPHRAAVLAGMQLMARTEAEVSAAAQPSDRSGFAMISEVVDKLDHHVTGLQAGLLTIEAALGEDVALVVADVTLDFMVGNFFWAVQNPQNAAGIPWFLAASRRDASAFAASVKTSTAAYLSGSGKSMHAPLHGNPRI